MRTTSAWSLPGSGTLRSPLFPRQIPECQIPEPLHTPISFSENYILNTSCGLRGARRRARGCASLGGRWRHCRGRCTLLKWRLRRHPLVGLFGGDVGDYHLRRHLPRGFILVSCEDLKYIILEGSEVSESTFQILHHVLVIFLKEIPLTITCFVDFSWIYIGFPLILTGTAEGDWDFSVFFSPKMVK